MCGIAGLLSRDEAAVRRGMTTMVAAQRHRGPDGCGYSTAVTAAGVLALGHSRLAIIDLSELGGQPMIHQDTGAALVFNGEIYNFRELRRALEHRGIQFRGNSDSEVLLHALLEWGTDALTKLRGMFALALFDPRTETLLLARDPLGIKPLYIGSSGGSLGFASEVRALLASGLFPSAVNDRAVSTYLAYGAVQAPDTIFKSIVPFPPGSWQRWDLSTNVPRPTATRRFWEFPEPNSSMTEEEAVAAVSTTLDDAVRMHLVSDVPVGVLLSSGLDSTIVTSLAARHSADIRTFSVGFADHDDFSELALANETARRLGVRHTSIPVTDSEARERLQGWLASLDQPSMDGWNVYTVCSTVREHGIRVALSGQGGDELFGGYSSFTDVPKALGIHERLGHLPRSALGMLVSVGSALSNSARVDKAADMVACDGSVLSLYLHRRRTLSDRHMKALGVVPESLNLTADFLPREVVPELRLGADTIANVSQLESIFYLGNMLLRDSDTNGMAHSLELRVPMLDTVLLNLVYSLPGDRRLPHGRADKHLLRLSFGSLLQERHLQAPKRGFALPIGRWMVGPLREFCEASLHELQQWIGVRPEGVRRIWTSFLKTPDSPSWSRAWELCVLGSYLSSVNSAAEAA